MGRGSSLDAASALDPLLIVSPNACSTPDAMPFVLGGPIEGDEGVRIAIGLVTAFVIPVPRDQLRPTEVPASEFIACTPNDGVQLSFAQQRQLDAELCAGPPAATLSPG